jgi:hypothetical protein
MFLGRQMLRCLVELNKLLRSDGKLKSTWGLVVYRLLQILSCGLQPSMLMALALSQSMNMRDEPLLLCGYCVRPGSWTKSRLLMQANSQVVLLGLSFSKVSGVSLQGQKRAWIAYLSSSTKSVSRLSFCELVLCAGVGVTSDGSDVILRCMKPYA